MTRATILGLVLLLAIESRASAQYPEWRHTGSLYILTTPEGADLPASASETDFPLLVRLHRDFFDFSQASSHGEDIRFSTAAGAPLPFQIEEWNASGGDAAIWVRIPTIQGNARQEIRMHWGNPEARSASAGAEVFNGSSGYLATWHMSEPVRDEVGALASTDAGTSDCPGVIGRGRRFAGRQGIRCGEAIAGFPSGDQPSTSEAWIRADQVNTDILAWGNEGGGSGTKIRMRLASPPHIKVDSDFADVAGSSRLDMGRWIHVVHTYQRGDSRIYVNGRLDGRTAPRFAIKDTVRMWIGGWYDDYSFIGDIDEVRISRVARSADWIRLEYENQKSLQTLVGPLVQPGDDFSVSPASLTLAEGKSAALTARAGGAQKISWILLRDGRETLAAVDRFTFTFEAGRVAGDAAAAIRFKAVLPGGIKTVDIPITITEAIPDPKFALKAPADWNGRDAIEVAPVIDNLDALRAAGAGKLNERWTISGPAVIREIVPGKLILKRSQGSGRILIELAMENGGAAVVARTEIAVTEPESDRWVQRTPEKDEWPEDNQFIARDDRDEGVIHVRGTLKEAADSVFLRVCAGTQLCANEAQKPAADGSYAFAVKVKAGLVKYRVELGSRTGDRETSLHIATNLVCGDAYLIDGQSNAVATDVGEEDPPFKSEWIRSYGSTSGDPAGARLELWGDAVCRDRNGGKLQIGLWGLELARRLVESRKVPICIVNGAVGGTRIDQHQRNPADPPDASTIYGRLLWRVRRARLTHGIRAVIWHQGENDQGADGPTGGFGWETYRQLFFDLAAAWKTDYPNLQHYYIYQIWPKACAMGVDGSDNMLREVQRTLPSFFSRLSIMSTLGIKPPGGCHYPPAGYAEMARLICPLIERDIYGAVFAGSITPPDLARAWWKSERRDAIVLEFDQPVEWHDSLTSQFHLDDSSGKVTSGSASGSTLTLNLEAPAAAQSITYLDSSSWSPDNLLLGQNGIAALTFCRVAIASPPAGGPARADFYISPRGNDSWSGTSPDPGGKDGPFATLERARDAVRAKLKSQATPRGLRVELRGGTYHLDAPLDLGPEDSGSERAPVVYAAAAGERPVISGGRRLAGGRWGEANGRKAWVIDIPEVKDGRWRFRQLFVNGVRRTRTRLPSRGEYRIESLPGYNGDFLRSPTRRFVYAPGNISPDWRNLHDVEVVGITKWLDNRLPIESVDGEHRTVTFDRPSLFALVGPGERPSAYWVENVFEALADPGQWYLDRTRGALEYLPEPGEEMAAAEVIAPRLAQVVRVVGRAGAPVHDVHFEGLTFAHTEWEPPADYASSLQAGIEVPGALFFEYAERCTVTGCGLQHLGNYGIEVGVGCAGLEITRNRLTDLGAGGIRIGHLFTWETDGSGRLTERGEKRKASMPQGSRSKRVTVADNEISHLGRLTPEAVGVFIGDNPDNKVVHNHIHDLYYSGISVGSVQDFGPSQAAGNVIEHNLIHDIGQGMLSDLAGIYTCSAPGSRIAFNVIHHVSRRDYGGWGIYPDEGSHDLKIEKNLVYRCQDGALFAHHNRDITAENNIFALNRAAQIDRGGIGGFELACRRNIIYFTEGKAIGDYGGERWGADLCAFDRNLYWNASGEPVLFAAMSFSRWQALGQDKGGLVADPLFRDPERGDFTLGPGSPAEKIGFEPWDASAIGPRPAAAAAAYPTKENER
jgi:concanavalin A-like lectin/glucanase superfamily protein/uncharacterized protein DUF2341/carbohydrate esterase-like sialic acid-specific acetylesterase/parallel beta helix pectate lyase-like protein/glycosyl hydrolase family 141